MVHEPCVKHLDCFGALLRFKQSNKGEHVTNDEGSCAWCNFNALLLIEVKSLHSAKVSEKEEQEVCEAKAKNEFYQQKYPIQHLSIL